MKVRNKLSYECQLDIGVPQGSILGPLFLIMYTSDLDVIISKFNQSVHYYADYTQVYNLFSEDPDIHELTQCYNDIKFKDWMSKNYQKLNRDKTKLIEIEPYLNHCENIMLGDSIATIENAKNLGLIFDYFRTLQSDSSITSNKGTKLASKKLISSLCYRAHPVQLQNSPPHF